MIEILEPGPQTTVQDRGRHGQLRAGIPPSGPMDLHAFVLANRLVGNDAHAAVLECTFAGPRFVVERDCALAVTGADMALTRNGQAVPAWRTLRLQAGDMVKLGAARAGMRSYIAFAGGIDVPVRLGSRATYLRGKLGGFEGRALRKGDRLATLPAPAPTCRAVSPDAIPNYRDALRARVVLGPQADRFTPAGIDTFLGSAYTVLPQSDRMGMRLEGSRIEHVQGPDIVSDGIALGAVQVPGDGQPLVLLADRQSTGGYTKIATVCSFDIGRVGQLRPGQSVRFEPIAIEDAHRLLHAWRAALASPLLACA
jgi:biotin-dependent carboxylase-like uncharacterized protein